MRSTSVFLTSTLSVAVLMSSGCGVASESAGAFAGVALAGSVHGGQQPVSGAQVYMYASGTAGYGSTPASLLAASGGFVTTNGGGEFSFGDFTCPAADAQIYLVAAGGNTGAGINASSVMMAALGPCGNINSGTFVAVNEISTVASVWALQQFMAPGTVNVGTSATNTPGLKNAFLQVPNLISTGQGTANAATPAANGIVPLTTINTLANIMASCVNGVTGSPGCTQLFAATTPPGGTAPADTLTAMLDVAQNPGNNVGQIFLLSSATPPFLPQFPAAPNDFTLSVQYSGGGMNSPYLLAVDGFGNVWVPNGSGTTQSTGVVSEFNSTGASLQGSTGIVIPNTGSLLALAIDQNNNVWTQGNNNLTTTSIFKLSNSGANLSGDYGFPWGATFLSDAIAIDGNGSVFSLGSESSANVLGKMTPDGAVTGIYPLANASDPFGLAIDSSDNLWVVSEAQTLIQKVSANGSSLGAPYAGGGLNYPASVAIDASGDAWVANEGGQLASEFDSSGTAMSASGYGPTGGATAVAVDGANTIWLTGFNNSLNHVSNSGRTLSPLSGYTNNTTSNSGALPYGMALDASGNIWVSVYAGVYASTNPGSWLVEYVGVAAPVTTPMASGVKNGAFGLRP